MEFHPGDQKNGIRAAGGCSAVPSIENASGESVSVGGAGSDTSIFTNTAVLPLSRCGERGIFAPAMRKAAEGAASFTAARHGNALDIAASTSSKSCQRSGFNQRQLAETEFCGTNTWKNRWARPSLLTKVPSDSANVPAGRTKPAIRVVGLSRRSRTTT